MNCALEPSFITGSVNVGRWADGRVIVLIQEPAGGSKRSRTGIEGMLQPRPSVGPTFIMVGLADVALRAPEAGALSAHPAAALYSRQSPAAMPMDWPR